MTPSPKYAAMPADPQTKVLLFSEDQRALDHLTSVVTSVPEARLVCRTGDRACAESIAAVGKPDVAVMVMPARTRGFDFVRTLRGGNPALTLIVLSDRPTEIEQKTWREAGVDFYFGTSEAVSALPDLL